MTESLRSLTPKLTALGGVLAALAAALYGWQVWTAPPTEVLLPRSSCDLNAGACAQTLPTGATVRFAIGPQPIPVMEDLDLKADFTGKTPDRVAVDLNGTTMKMAANQPQLQPVGNNRFEGKTALSVCITGAMQWQAVLQVDYGRTRYLLPFVFDSAHSDDTELAKPLK
ncbi:hypothetical protein [Denitromonas ohlonensis]|jgi:hypothetical protein|uniref:Uncharacterized protein n=2 Tax=Denitromonas TaxID=139331 RepID=A0A558ESC6_9RHOO|nr:hypothetical protein [Denitromonas ohlonensis]TVT50940.1 MAG: hypothetical protein FHP94_01120 [Denitromonas halophila]TVO67202.1 hypothetical protein FHP90_08585 [Denitromonas ohlonensis]TVO79262.1 hypothetical protein FHP89_03505 [Denitromonas ohlonensis]TVT68080.1 MAG: hypothetical protein FHP93_16020 [Denitromonas halophila]TVT76305.1 MAG: hypothetical protein FHP92_09815 [Denitromonas halophila]